MKVKAIVSCQFEIEYEDDNLDIRDTKENITMSDLEELACLETDDSIQFIRVLEIEKVKYKFD